MRLLIVEDEKELCDTLAKSLYGAGYEVDAAPYRLFANVSHNSFSSSTINNLNIISPFS